MRSNVGGEAGLPTLARRSMSSSDVSLDRPRFFPARRFAPPFLEEEMWNPGHTTRGSRVSCPRYQVYSVAATIVCNIALCEVQACETRTLEMGRRCRSKPRRSWLPHKEPPTVEGAHQDALKR